MASFQAKIRWKMQRKRQNKNYRSVSFLPGPSQKIPKKQQKNSKNQKIPLWLLEQKQVRKGREREKIKIIVLFRSRPVREHSKKIAKKFKKLKNTIMTSFQAKICWKRLRNRENKNYRYVTFPPNGLEKITKKQQKN